jgi:hypothetical protein
LLAAGAQIVSPGGSASFEAAAGGQLVSGILVGDSSYEPLNDDSIEVNVPRNETVNVFAFAEGDDTVLEVD